MASRYCVVVTRQEGREPVVYGTWLNGAVADERATRLNDHFERELPGCAASVVEVYPASLSTRLEDVVEDVS